MKVYLKSFSKRVPGLHKAVRLLRGQTLETSRDALLYKMPRRSVCAEIGVHKGDYSEDILCTLNPTRLHLIDPWKHEEGEQYEEAWFGGAAGEGQTAMDQRFAAVQSRFDKEIKAQKVVLNRGYSNEIVIEFEDNYFDWIYIDGNHLYEYVKQDLELFYPKIKSGGYLTGDDYGVEGWWDNGVQKAVDEFVEQRPHLSLQVIESQFIIRKSM